MILHSHPGHENLFSLGFPFYHLPIMIDYSAHFHRKCGKRKSLGEGRWRTCEEASVATAGPKRLELMVLGARHPKKRQREYFNT